MGTMEDLQMAKSMAQGSLSNDKMMIYMTQKKSEALLGVCSFLIPGLGQIIGGSVGKGIVILILDYFLFILGFVTTFFIIGFFILIIPFIIWIWNIFDAVNIAKQYNMQLLMSLQD